MNKSYCIYRIRVANRKSVQVEKRDAQYHSLGESNGTFCEKKLKEIELLLNEAACNGLNDSSKVRKLGEGLFDVLFDDGLRHDFVNFYYQVVKTDEQLLRVELDIDQKILPDVAALPWEFLCLPEKDNLGTIWMGTVPNLAFSRRPSMRRISPIQLGKDEKLKIALVVSNPSDLDFVAYQEVQEALEKLAKEQPDRVELLPIVYSANPKEMHTILLRKPHILHFIGHGRLQNENNQEMGEIAFVDRNLGKAMWVDANYFSNLLNQHGPGIVMLQACEGAMLSASKAFVGVASKIVGQNIPVVVAMQYEVTNSTAKLFALSFYEQLAKDQPVDIAVQCGRQDIAFGSLQYRKRDFATPVIFMGVDNGYLFSDSNLVGSPQLSQNTQKSMETLKILEIGEILEIRESLNAKEHLEIRKRLERLEQKLQQLELEKGTFQRPLSSDNLVISPEPIANLDAVAFELNWNLMLLLFQQKSLNEVEGLIIGYADLLNIKLPEEWRNQIETAVQTDGQSFMDLISNLGGQIFSRNKVAGLYFQSCYNLLFDMAKDGANVKNFISDLNLPEELRQPQNNKPPDLEWINKIHEYIKERLP